MTVGVVGLGLIGGSIGLALRKPDRRIIGYDPSQSAIDLALGRQCVDEAVSLEQVAQADVVFVASPPAAVTGNLEALVKNKADSTVLTDCASAKSEIVEWADRTRTASFVPGHPMAGHEKSTAAFSSSWMFRHARWILCPLPFTDRKAIQAVETLIKEMGGTTLRMKAATHDSQVAILSHLPHVMAAVLVRMGEDLESTEIAGGSWRDLTRVGGVDPDLWTQILMGNRKQVIQVLADSQRHFESFRTALELQDESALRSLLQDAVRAKQKHEPAPKKPVARKR